jgi:uncharacterized integral membrane protein
MKLLISFLIIGLAVVSAALLSVQNATSVSIHFGIWRSIELPLGLVLSIGVGVGFLLAVILTLAWRFTDLYSDLDEVSFADRSSLGRDGGDE